MGPRDLNTPGLTGHMARVIARSEARRGKANAEYRSKASKPRAPKRKGGRSRKDGE